MTPDFVAMLSASAEGVEFMLVGAWAGRTEITVEGIRVRVPVFGIEEFVRNKRASGRPRDRADLILIGRG